MLRRLFGSHEHPSNAVGTMTVQELKTNIDNHTPSVLIDVRQPEEFAEGHVAGARLLPLPVLSQRIDEIPKDATIYCICRSGNRSQLACEMLKKQGYTDITNVQGGMLAWQRAGLPIARY